MREQGLLRPFAIGVVVLAVLCALVAGGWSSRLFAVAAWVCPALAVTLVFSIGFLIMRRIEARLREREPDLAAAEHELDALRQRAESQARTNAWALRRIVATCTGNDHPPYYPSLRGDAARIMNPQMTGYRLEGDSLYQVDIPHDTDGHSFDQMWKVAKSGIVLVAAEWQEHDTYSPGPSVVLAKTDSCPRRATYLCWKGRSQWRIVDWRDTEVVLIDLFGRRYTLPFRGAPHREVLQFVSDYESVYHACMAPIAERVIETIRDHDKPALPLKLARVALQLGPQVTGGRPLTDEKWEGLAERDSDPPRSGK